MGGPGSGRRFYWDAKATVGECLSLDVRILHKKGALTPKAISTCTWHNKDGEEAAAIRIYAYDGRVRIVYTITQQGKPPQEVDVTVLLNHTPCNYGGMRPWFICPDCERRVAKLYLRRGYFRCRHCHNLAYQSQQEGEMFRLLSKAQKIREKLGGSPDIFELFPEKPKYMHWNTYSSLYKKARHIEERLCIILLQHLGDP